MDPSTQCDGYFTNLLNNNEVLMSVTNEEEILQPQVEFIEIESSGRKIRGNNFTNDEDLLLVNGWLEISLDAVQGKDQKHKILWKRIHKYFEDNNKFGTIRNYISLMNRWSTIQQATNKFCGYLAQVERVHPSGCNEQDKIGKAKAMFVEFERKSYNFDHCWRVLRLHPKWVEHMDLAKPKKKQSSNDSTPNSSNLGEENYHIESSNLERPIGRKAEKEKRKRKELANVDSLVALKEMVEIRNSKLLLMQEARDHDNKMLCLRQEEVLIQKEKVQLQQVKVRLEEKKEEERIMTLDTNAMPPMLQQYYLQRQREILASRIEEEKTPCLLD